ncbi:hypothetical protein GCM10025867_22830 [Frondihabitans sucicola]|uniref:Uncharacterized protein n=1 Tax=Frondihabitans sucicola TaxID=1268041 RepID=A0ABN6Y1Q5_9MICO|nr:hypothetical protein GCM10025867_22830 [Frondihabitans sucicola]
MPSVVAAAALELEDDPAPDDPDPDPPDDDPPDDPDPDADDEAVAFATLPSVPSTSVTPDTPVTDSSVAPGTYVASSLA